MFNKNKEETMIIGIDARFLGLKQKGLGCYIQKLVQNLEKIVKNSNYKFIVFLRKENWNEYQPSNPSFKKVLADYTWYGLGEQILMPLKIRQQRIDLMHFPHFNVPIFYFKPFVVTIHDLILKRFSTRRASTLSPVLYWLKNIAYQVVINSAVKRAKKIIAVSNYTKQDILKYFKVDPEKIQVIYEGAPRIKPKRLRGSKNKPYLLYVGNAYPHKNLERLILAHKKLVEDENMDLRLVLVGEIDYFYKRLKNIALDSVVFTDFVSNQELADLYQNASLYVFPSLCEGFGLPPLEAMAHNLPVVCSKASCLPEVLGQAVLYFEPEDVDDIANSIRKVLTDEELKQKLVLQGIKTIQQYSWIKMAQQTLNIYICP